MWLTAMSKEVMMRRILIPGSLIVLLAAFASTGVAHAEHPQTFTVLVGAEDADVGAAAPAFFPGTVTIHVGDTVHWQRNTHEFHTVTFLAGIALTRILRRRSSSGREVSPSM
jgi:plastocyanin